MLEEMGSPDPMSPSMPSLWSCRAAQQGCLCVWGNDSVLVLAPARLENLNLSTMLSSPYIMTISISMKYWYNFTILGHEEPLVEVTVNL